MKINRLILFFITAVRLISAIIIVTSTVWASENLPQVEQADSWVPNVAQSSNQLTMPSDSDTNTNIDANTGANTTANTTAGFGSSPNNQDQASNLSQRVTILQRSLANINQMDFPSQIAQLQQQLQQLSGRIDVLQHQLKQLKNNAANHADLASSDNIQRNAEVLNQSTDKTTDKTIEKTIDKGKSALPAVNPNLSPEEQVKRTYDAAFSLVRAHAYQDAIDAFNGYLEIYGDKSTYSANAYYWLGELDAHQQHYDKAQEALTKIVTDYPKSNKAPDAMLKLGIIAQKQGDQAKANEWLRKVMQSYPGTTSAKLAKNYLH